MGESGANNMITKTLALVSDTHHAMGTRKGITNCVAELCTSRSWVDADVVSGGAAIAHPKGAWAPERNYRARKSDAECFYD